MTKIIPHTGTADKGPDSQYVAEDKKNQMLHQVRVYKGHTLYEVDIDEETYV